MRWLAVALLFSCPVAAMPDGWKPPSVIETIPMVLTVGLVWTDVLQSKDGLRRGYQESNPLLGKQPSNAKLILLGGVLPTLVLTAVWYCLPSPHRSIFLIAPLAIEGETVWENASKGLVIRF